MLLDKILFSWELTRGDFVNEMSCGVIIASDMKGMSQSVRGLNWFQI